MSPANTKHFTLSFNRSIHYYSLPFPFSHSAEHLSCVFSYALIYNFAFVSVVSEPRFQRHPYPTCATTYSQLQTTTILLLSRLDRPSTIAVQHQCRSDFCSRRSLILLCVAQSNATHLFSYCLLWFNSSNALCIVLLPFLIMHRTYLSNLMNYRTIFQFYM